ncbi:pentapeptide repeat-containing protein [Candidatus Nitrospira inopinata]|jgi:uncharacterized protein YjbI with pentapeptide repeats|uniref:Pentapeptide repeat-containing protein n=1 Tax=Candidatus Nitrospira inopinata TaxID=1715989 RepID=A0A0S4KYC0_9BACT|nr:pentapeptide repeat-containing protein [Candidatus Nitrospira inopinata]CUQ68250.1 protein of unknown function [Candidatus Nitrospira inopinata]
MKGIPARLFLQDLKIHNGRMECVRVVGDLNLHDAVAGGARSVKVVNVTDCVFDSVEVIDRRRSGSSSSSPRHEAIVPLMIFKKCVFRKRLLLHDLHFQQHVEFEGCRFEQYVDCARSHFSGVSFHDCAFDETVYFQGTCFAGRNSANGNMIDTDFSEVTFQKGADFDGAVFFGSATFKKARFYEATTFTDIRFRSHVNVGSSSQSLARFSPVFSFTAVQVFGSVGFLESGNDLKTENAISKGSGFHRSQARSCERLLGRETFVRLFEERRNDQWGQSREEPLELDFTYVSVHSKYGLRFHSVNLEKCKLAGTNLDLCYFNNVRWPRVRAHVPASALRGSGIWAGVIYKITKPWSGLAWLLRWLVWSLPLGAGSRNEEERQREIRHRQMYGIYDHACLVKEMESQSDSDGRNNSTPWPYEEKAEELAQLSKAYRDLKVAYEQDRDYIYASDFHYGEKELRRINPTVPWPTKFQLNLFWMINGYGERALRPVGWFLLVFVIGTFVYWWNGDLGRRPSAAFAVSEPHAAVTMPDVASGPSPEIAPIGLLEAAGFSLGTLAFLKPDFLVLKTAAEGRGNWTWLMIWFQTLAGPALFAMFALAIRNKLKR